MSKFSEVENDPGQWLFYCPGCETHHSVWTKPNPNRVLWSFNNDINKPTISPSLKIQLYSNKLKKKILCHSFIKDGNIQYLNDCTHELAGQTIELPNWEDI